MTSYIQFASHASAQCGREEVIIVSDASPSMLTTDWLPSRLDGARTAITALAKIKAEQYPCDRIGLVAFHSTSQVLLPCAPAGENFGPLRHSLRSIETESGTNITAGLKAAGRLLKQNGTSPTSQHRLGRIARWLYGGNGDERETGSTVRRILLLSDGCHNTGSSPLAVARSLKSQGIIIDVIGIGGSHDADELDEDMLKRIASTNADGTPRYCFIGDRDALIEEFKRRAHHIKAL